MKKVYIASSWKNQHAVELLTAELRRMGFEVSSWVENSFKEVRPALFEDWIDSDDSGQAFNFDSLSAEDCDIFIYLGPAGKDAAAECGIAYGSPKNKRMYALWTKGEDFGLMRKMFDVIFTRYTDLLKVLKTHY